MTRLQLSKVFVFVGSVFSVLPFTLHFAQARAPGDNSSTQANKFSLLEQESLVARIESGKYGQIRMKPEVKVVSRDLFTRYAKDFGLSKDDAFKLVLSKANPLTQAKSKNVIRYQQHYKNLPVMGLEYVLQTDAANHVLAASGKMISGLNVDTNASISESRALEAAKRAVPAEVYSWDKEPSKVPKANLAISFKDFKVNRKNARLVYRFTISSEKPSQSYVVEVDAHSGEVLNKISNHISDVVDWNQNISNCQLAGLGNWNNPVVCDQGTDGKYRLMCTPGTMGSCAAPLKIIDGRRPNPQAQGGADPNQDYVIADEDNQNPPIFGEKNVPGESDDIIGEYFYASMLLSMRFYSLYLDWAGWDGLGQIPLLAYLKTTDTKAPAEYHVESHSIYFDPGNTVTVDSSGNVNTWLAIAAGHEFTHGVLDELVPGLVYAGETASLDESFSDIMGILGVYYGRTCQSVADFKTCLAEGGNAERMTDPQGSDLPTTYKGYFYAGSDGCNASATCYRTPQTTISCDNSNNNCDPAHRNDTVQNYMFYLLASGGAGTNDPPLNHPYNVEGIGPYEAAQIAFQTMRARLSPTSTYPEARDEWIDAAKDLYGKDSREVQAVTLAWYAVGIGDISGMDVSHSPADGTENVPPWPTTLEWEDQPDEIEWEVETSTSPDFDRDVLTKDTLVATRSPSQSASSSVKFDLKPASNYYWRVHAMRKPSSSGKSSGDSKATTQVSQAPTLQSAWGDWSLLRYFKTDARASTLKSPIVTSPKVYPWNGEFKWAGVDGAKQYWLDTSEKEDLGLGSNLGPGKVVLGSPQIIQPSNPLQSLSLSGVFVGPSDPDNIEGANLVRDVLPFPLKVNHTYYWGVLPYGPENIQGNWSNNQKGQIFETSTPRTKLAAPENAATVSPWGIALEWEKTRGAIGYALKVSTHPDLSDNIYTGPDPVGTSQVLNLAETTEGQAGVSQVPQIGMQNPTNQLLHRDYYWSVTPDGPPPYSEKGRASETWGFNIDRKATKPVLVSPPDGSHVPHKQPKLHFIWESVDHAVEYVFTIFNQNNDGSRGATLDSKSVLPSSKDSEHRPYLDLENEGVTEKTGYCWQVQAIGPKDLEGNSLEGPPSDTFCYVLAPDKPILTGPPNGARDVEYDPTTFTWESEWAPGGYMISVTTPGSSGSWVNVSGKSYSPDLKPDTNYAWTVDAKGLNGELTNSELWHFSTKAAPCNAPDAPEIVDPPGNPNGQIISQYPYQYRWSSVPGAIQYEFTVYWVNYSNPSVRSVVFHSYYTGAISGSISITCGNQNVYLWSVRAKNACGAWSALSWSSYFTCQ